MAAQFDLDLSENLRPGAALRKKWQVQANSHPLTIPLAGLAKRAWREGWPTPSEAGVFLVDVADLSKYLHQLETQLAALTGGAE